MLAENVADGFWRSRESDGGVNGFEYPAGVSGDFVLGFGISLTKQGALRLIARDNFLFTQHSISSNAKFFKIKK